MNNAFAYVLMGSAGSGRGEVLIDLLSALSPTDRVVVCVSEEESDKAGVAFGTNPDSFILASWRGEGGEISAEVPEGTTHFFFVADGRRNPVDQMEAFYHWSQEHDLELARIITVVHCGLAHDNPDLKKWYDACIHFSDYVLLNRREGISEKWIKAFQDRYRKAFYPCIFEIVKKGRVKNPTLVLDPLPRRMSQLFDDNVDLEIDLGEEDVADQEEKIDPYLDRLPSGKRARDIPDIAPYLSREEAKER